MLIALGSAALIAGLAGAWSPCGFSMVDTLAPQGYARRMCVTVVACVAFAVGALAGGAATFGGLALLGAELGTGGGAAVAAAVAALLVAAAGDAAGRRIVPQVRRQVPESWRRTLPVALAAALYGVLLGLGFTTFVLSFAVYALAAVCLALGEPQVGVGVGLAFAAGRIVPVVVLAPLQDTDRGLRLAGAMGERPGVLRAIRAAGAVALGAAAIALALGGAPASASSPAAPGVLTTVGTDPSASGDIVAWQAPGGGQGIVQRPGQPPYFLPGPDAALGPDSVVWREGEQLVVAALDGFGERLRITAPGVEEPAISARWLAWRAREPTGDVLRVLDLQTPEIVPVEIRRTFAPDRIGRPSIDGDHVVFHVATRSSSTIEEVFVPTGRRAVLRSGRDGALVLNPSEQGDELLYVSSSAERQRVLVGPRRGRDGSLDRLLYSSYPTARRDAGHDRDRDRHRVGYPGGRPPALPTRGPEGVELTLWTTALGPDAAYVTRIRRTAARTTTVVLVLARFVLGRRAGRGR